MLRVCIKQVVIQHHLAHFVLVRHLRKVALILESQNKQQLAMAACHITAQLAKIISVL